MSQETERQKPVAERVQRIRKRLKEATSEQQWRSAFMALLDLLEDEL